MSAGFLRMFNRSVWILGLIVSLTIVGGCAQGPSWKMSDLSWFNKKKKETEELGPKIAAPADRVKAMQELAEKSKEMSQEEKERHAIELARGIQHEEDAILRQQVLRTLAVLPCPVTTAVLTAAVSDTDADVRVVCCDAWAHHGGPDAVKVLCGVLNSDTDLDVRLAAARALGVVGDKAAIETLGTALDDKDPAMQHRVIVSLHKITGKDFGDNVNTWRDYVHGGTPEELSVAEKLKRYF
ncbi:MAG TPA: HEAT repeat domain-containing protein [Pirellulales bacterium]|nr:HEAT repeat domain-containing protein [Pirellulales bacterium]